MAGVAGSSCGALDSGIMWADDAGFIGGAVSDLAVSGSDLYAGGNFTSAGGLPAANIAKWNGSSWSALGSGMNDSVHAVAVSGDNLYAGGDFSEAGGRDALHIAKWKGSDWNAVGSGINGIGGPVVLGSDLY